MTGESKLTFKPYLSDLTTSLGAVEESTKSVLKKNGFSQVYTEAEPQLPKTAIAADLCKR